MKKILNKLLQIHLHADATEDEQEIEYKVAFLNSVFFFAGIVAFGMGFIRWLEGAVLWMIDFGFAGLAFALLYYLHHHKQQIELISDIALMLSFLLFLSIYLLAPANTTRSSLFYLLSASAFFLKGRKPGFLWLVFILLCIVSVSLFTGIDTGYSHLDVLTLCLYLIALFFIFDSYETIKVDQKKRLEQLNLRLEEKIQERTGELQHANRLLAQLNEELDRKVQERTQQLLAAQEELVRNEKLAMLGKIAGNVGHELRNPLGVMSNAVYFLQTVLPNADDSVKEYLNIIRNEIAGSERIISDLLDAVRTRLPNAEVVGVRELIEQTLRKLSLPSSVTVKLEIPEMIPLLRVDPLQIRQVLRNLISNAVDAMPGGGVLEIGASADASTGTITISVRDTGSGMTPEQLGKLFQPLFTTKARGIGLGLVVVKNLTQANGGTVKVESEPGKGSVISVTLPGANPAATA